MKAALVKWMHATTKTDPAIVVVKNGRRLIPDGAIIDHPQAFLLVTRGVALPADDECRYKLSQLRWSQSDLMKKFDEMHIWQMKCEKNIRAGIVNKSQTADHLADMKAKFDARNRNKIAIAS